MRPPGLQAIALMRVFRRDLWRDALFLWTKAVLVILSINGTAAA